MSFHLISGGRNIANISVIRIQNFKEKYLGSLLVRYAITAKSSDAKAYVLYWVSNAYGNVKVECMKYSLSLCSLLVRSEKDNEIKKW